MRALAGKVILVTGAARRIGRTIALRASAEGATVAIHYHESEAEARQTAVDCGHAPLFRADLSQVAEIETLFAQVDDRFGRLDGLVNNAARFRRLDPLTATEAEWDAIHSVNLKALFFCCQQAARRMLTAGGGRIVNLASVGGLRPWPDHAPYCAAKAGVVMLTQALAKAFAPHVTVNAVAPGLVPMEEWTGRMEPIVQATPAGRVGTPDEVADAVLFFLTTNSFTTGQILAVDGGLSQR